MFVVRMFGFFALPQRWYNVTTATGGLCPEVVPARRRGSTLPELPVCLLVIEVVGSRPAWVPVLQNPSFAWIYGSPG